MYFIPKGLEDLNFWITQGEFQVSRIHKVISKIIEVPHINKEMMKQQGHENKITLSENSSSKRTQ